MSLDKKTLEGIMTNNAADTSTAGETNPEEVDELSLSNTTVPTEEEQENANIEVDVHEEEAAPEVNPEPGDTTEPETAPETEPGNEAMEESIENDLPSEPEPQVDPEGVSEATATKTFTQSQVDEIAGKVRKETREKVMRDIYSRYGVNTADELDDLVGDAQRFATSQDEFAEKERAWKEQDAARTDELTSVKERVALLESGIDNSRFEDARLILRGKGLEVTAENIAAELATHPEWKKQEMAPSPVEEAGLPFRKTGNVPVPQAEAGPATQISIPTLGNNSSDNPQPELSERERALRMFKV